MGRRQLPRPVEVREVADPVVGDPLAPWEKGGGGSAAAAVGAGRAPRPHARRAAAGRWRGSARAGLPAGVALRLVRLTLDNVAAAVQRPLVLLAEPAAVVVVVVPHDGFAALGLDHHAGGARARLLVLVFGGGDVPGLKLFVCRVCQRKDGAACARARTVVGCGQRGEGGRSAGARARV